MLRTLHRGALFDVLLIAPDGRAPVCLKRRAQARAQADAGLFQSTWTLNYTSALINCTARAGAVYQPEDAPTDALLACEARRVRDSQRAWNHSILDIVQLDDGLGLGLGLVMPFHDGQRLCDLPRDEQRALLPRMLPAMWRALATTPHGDLHRANMILLRGGERFALIDPSSYVYRGESERFHDSGELIFTTCLDNYPLLGPHYMPRARLSDGLTLTQHHEHFTLGLGHATTPRAVGERTIMVASYPGELNTATKYAANEPHPSDLHALGIIYYKILTATHPYFDDEFPSPCWLGGEVWDHFPIRFESAIARTRRPVTPPRAVAAEVTPAEDALALALLTLQVPTRDRLLELVRAALAALDD